MHVPNTPPTWIPAGLPRCWEQVDGAGAAAASAASFAGRPKGASLKPTRKKPKA